MVALVICLNKLYMPGSYLVGNKRLSFGYMAAGKMKEAKENKDTKLFLTFIVVRSRTTVSLENIKRLYLCSSLDVLDFNMCMNIENIFE